MYAVEKKFEIEMKLKREMTNIQELKAAAKRSSTLASDVCNVLGACEQRLQQLETAVLPLYGDTARLQQIHHNMEHTVTALDHVINYYMVSRELADLIQAGPHTGSTESLNIYLEALDKLAEAQNYFNKNNPQSVELENINQLYNAGVLKLENAFEELLSRNTRPLSPTSLMDMIALEEDSSVDSVSVSGGNSTSSIALETMRAAAAWLSAAGRPPAGPLLAIRGPAALNSLVAFKDYLRSRSMAASPLMRAKNILHRTDSTQRRTSKIQKVLEKRAINIMMKASQTLEQSTGLAIGPRRSINDSYSEECSDAVDEREAEAAGSLAAALCRLARREQRHALGLVPLPRLAALLAALLKDCLALLAAEVERVCLRSRKAAARCNAGAAACWALAARLQRLQPDLQRALHPASPAPYAALLNSCTHHCVRSLEEWVEGVRGDGAAGAVDGTVHQLAAAALAYCHALAAHMHVIGPALSTEAWYARAASALTASDRNALMLALYMRKVLAQLNLSLRNKSEQYSDALKAIFLLNNTLYLLQGLQRSGLLDILMLAEPECEANYRDMIQDYKNSYIQRYVKIITDTRDITS
ncbi:exocyst complex component 7 isoform X2 [Nymphalis io]|uniref:exocyst complex component 7 isoform X2 n=1 Tax=Inachis io TaxID=171585 RepID=UPI002168EF7E|nr:exocyst complex component 7 isoform X2 [Nymphalis io]XP_050342007.1 exocyst complex component 7 isoform X2 [Nymphalis io]XP_050342008.1 exocyst complex component 7 isoform X2 [Nymphalis io]